MYAGQGSEGPFARAEHFALTEGKCQDARICMCRGREAGIRRDSGRILLSAGHQIFDHLFDLSDGNGRQLGLF